MKKLKLFTSIFIGIFLTSFTIWNILIRVRLPRDIPFDLSLIGFVLLFYICIIYFVNLVIQIIKYRKIKPKLSLSGIKKEVLDRLILFLDIIYKPLITLDQSIKSNRIIKPYYEVILSIYLNFIDNILFKFKYSYLTLYVLYELFPRIVLVTAIFIDTFIYITF